MNTIYADVLRVQDNEENFTDNRLKTGMLGWASDNKKLIFRDSSGYHKIGDNIDPETLISEDTGNALSTGTDRKLYIPDDTELRNLISGLQESLDNKLDRRGDITNADAMFSWNGYSEFNGQTELKNISQIRLNHTWAIDHADQSLISDLIVSEFLGESGNLDENRWALRRVISPSQNSILKYTFNNMRTAWGILDVSDIPSLPVDKTTGLQNELNGKINRNGDDVSGAYDWRNGITTFHDLVRMPYIGSSPGRANTGRLAVFDNEGYLKGEGGAFFEHSVLMSNPHESLEWRELNFTNVRGTVALHQLPDVISGQLVHAGTFEINATFTNQAILTVNGKNKIGTGALNVIQLVNSQNGNGISQYGYGDCQGCFFILADSGMFANEKFGVGDWLVAIDSGWVKIGNADSGGGDSTIIEHTMPIPANSPSNWGPLPTGFTGSNVHVLSCKIIADGFQPDIWIVPNGLNIKGHKNEQQICIELQGVSYPRTAILLLMKR